VSENPNNHVYWKALVSELMKHIPPVPPINSPKEDKLSYRVARRNPKTYGGSYDPMKLEGLIRGMERLS